MKTKTGSFLMSFLLAASFSTLSFASEQPLEVQRDITEGKIAAIEAKTLESSLALLKSVDAKQARAILLINALGSRVNERFSNDEDKEAAQNAFQEYVARFEGIREDRELLARKEIMPDNKTLEIFSARLDSLIGDIQKFLK